MTTTHAWQRSLVRMSLLVGAWCLVSDASPIGGGSINPVGGFEIGNGMVINRTGGYGFKRPGNWEAGESGSLTQVIAPIQVGVPRPVIQADVVKSDANQFTDLGDLTTGDWDEVTLGNMAALTRTFRSENGLIRSDFKIKKSDGEFYLITVDFGVASNNNELYVMIKKSIESFQKIGSEE